MFYNIYLLVAFLFVSFLYASDCGYPDWVQGSTVVQNGDYVVNNSYIFQAHNSPSTYDTPPSDSIDNYYWYYSGVCYSSSDSTYSVNDALNSFSAGFLTISAFAVSGFSIGVISNILRRI